MDERDDLTRALAAEGASAAEAGELASVAADLRAMPREEFRSRLRAELETRAARMASREPLATARTATPCLVLRDAVAAIDFYRRAFGAVETMRLTGPGGQVVHAEIRIGDSPIQIAPEVVAWHNVAPQTLGGTTVTIALQVPDVDAVFARAVAEGAVVERPVTDYFYGERAGTLGDPFGHRWIVGTHIEDVSPEEMQRRLNALLGR